VAPSDDSSAAGGGTPVPPRGGKRKPNRPTSAKRPASGRSSSGPSRNRPTGNRPADRRKAALTKQRRQRQLLLAGAAIAVVVVVIAVFVVVKLTDSTSSSSNGSTVSASVNIPVSQATLDKMTAVSPKTLAAAANNFSTGFAGPTSVDGAPVATTGKPEVLYIGAEYCPFCATERWPMVLALSKFGTFKNLTRIHSSTTDTYPNTQTFSFYKSTYTSPYLNFVSVEEETMTGKKLQSATKAQQAILAKYDTINDQEPIPFVYLNGKGYISGAEYSPQLLQGKSFDDIADEIAQGSSKLASSVYADAGEITSYLCKMTGGKPGNVCASFPKTISNK
jgi:thiol-disulfide isomerase/thioredoxin